MARKASRSSIAKKAWKTRKANQRAAMGKPAAKIMTGLREALEVTRAANLSSLCAQLDDTISTLESRLTALNARISAIL